MGTTMKNSATMRVTREDKAIVEEASKRADVSVSEALHRILAGKLSLPVPAKPLTVTQMTEGLISHLRECNDAGCRAAVYNRLVTSGVLLEKPVTPGVDPGVARIIAAKKAVVEAARNKPPVTPVTAAPASEGITPWEACNISESKYWRNVDYYNAVLREMGYSI